MHWEPDEVPTEEMWAELKELLAGHPAKRMLWEGDPDAETVAKLKDIGVESVVLDPCGSVPAKDDFLLRMRKNVAKLKRAWEHH